MILAFAVFATTGCSSNSDDGDDNNPTGFCDQLLVKSQEYTNILTAFQEDPSETTCNNLRNSALEFIEAVKGCSEFSEQYADLENAAQEWTALDCSKEFGN
ncbi:hypothetical protein GSB9_02994 [Flavobacteriaceae bacterium GSB9]|nr:hypothetical protein GSB9_02994 [Flavobacteriaceae bacterium GSB9]